MSDTSETLKSTFQAIANLTDEDHIPDICCEGISMVEQLERELAEANAQLDAIKDLFDVEDRLSISVIREVEKAWRDSLRLDDLRQKINNEMPLDQWDRDNIDDEINREEKQNE